MTAGLRGFLLVGCTALLLLDAPRAGALLAQGVAGPYRELHPPAPAAEHVTDYASARLPISPGSLILGEREPWCEGLPGGL